MLDSCVHVRVCGRSLEVSYLETAVDEGNDKEHRALHSTGELSLGGSVDPSKTAVEVKPAEIKVVLEKAAVMAWKSLVVDKESGKKRKGG